MLRPDYFAVTANCKAGMGRGFGFDVKGDDCLQSLTLQTIHRESTSDSMCMDKHPKIA